MSQVRWPSKPMAFKVHHKKVHLSTLREYVIDSSNSDFFRWHDELFQIKCRAIFYVVLDQRACSNRVKVREKAMKEICRFSPFPNLSVIPKAGALSKAEGPTSASSIWHDSITITPKKYGRKRRIETLSTWWVNTRNVSQISLEVSLSSRKNTKRQH